MSSGPEQAPQGPHPNIPQSPLNLSDIQDMDPADYDSDKLPWEQPQPEQIEQPEQSQPAGGETSADEILDMIDQPAPRVFSEEKASIISIPETLKPMNYSKVQIATLGVRNAIAKYRQGQEVGHLSAAAARHAYRKAAKYNNKAEQKAAGSAIYRLGEDSLREPTDKRSALYKAQKWEARGDKRLSHVDEDAAVRADILETANLNPDTTLKGRRALAEQEARDKIAAANTAPKATAGAEAAPVKVAKTEKIPVVQTAENATANASKAEKKTSTEAKKDLHAGYNMDPVVEAFSDAMNDEQSVLDLAARLQSVHAEMKQLNALPEAERNSEQARRRLATLQGQERIAQQAVARNKLLDAFDQTYGVREDMMKTANLQNREATAQASINQLHEIDQTAQDFDATTYEYKLAAAEAQLKEAQDALKNTNPALLAAATKFARIDAEYKANQQHVEDVRLFAGDQHAQEAQRHADERNQGLFSKSDLIEAQYVDQVLQTKLALVEAQIAAQRQLIENADDDVKDLQLAVLAKYQKHQHNIQALKQTIDGKYNYKAMQDLHITKARAKN